MLTAQNSPPIIASTTALSAILKAAASHPHTHPLLDGTHMGSATHSYVALSGATMSGAAIGWHPYGQRHS